MHPPESPTPPGAHPTLRLHSRIPQGTAHRSPWPRGAGRFHSHRSSAGESPRDSRSPRDSGKMEGWLRSGQGGSNNPLSTARLGSVSRQLWRGDDTDSVKAERRAAARLKFWGRCVSLHLSWASLLTNPHVLCRGPLCTQTICDCFQLCKFKDVFGPTPGSEGCWFVVLEIQVPCCGVAGIRAMPRCRYVPVSLLYSVVTKCFWGEPGG